MGSKAKPVVKGQTILGTVKTVRGEFWLKADKHGIMRNLFGYLLAHYAKMYDIYIHSVAVMSNHYHVMFTDPFGRRTYFFKSLNAALATHIKIRFCRSDGTLFKKNDLHQMVLLDQEIIEDKHIYTITNPVCANIVERYEQYEHLVISHHHWNKPQPFERPEWFNIERWPNQHLILNPCPPSYFQSNSYEDNIAIFDDFVARSHQRYDEHRTHPVCGMEAVFAYPRHHSPNADQYIAIDDDIILSDDFTPPTPPPPPEHPTPELRFYRVSGEDRGRPDFCTTDPILASNYQSRISSWDTHYAESRADFPDNHDVCFPPGTNKLAQLGVNVEPLTDDDWLNPFYYGNCFVVPLEPSDSPDSPNLPDPPDDG